MAKVKQLEKTIADLTARIDAYTKDAMEAYNSNDKDCVRQTYISNGHVRCLITERQRLINELERVKITKGVA